MEYSKDWKYRKTNKCGGWSQKHNVSDPNQFAWHWHYIRYGMEYCDKEAFATKKECDEYIESSNK